MESKDVDFKIYPVTKKIFDIFWKEGWDNCVRDKKTKNNTIAVIKAFKKPPQHLLTAVKKALLGGKE